MHTHSELFKIFNDSLEKLDFGKTPKRLYDPIYYSINVGGKRIRPILCMLAAEMFDDTYQSAIDSAFGIEIFHNFTLLHDDMMDNADLRRGKPVVHVKWNENIALLSGDAMSVIAYKYVSETKSNLKPILDTFSDTALKICEGQQYDMDFETQDEVTADEYLKMINLKTAVLLAASLKIGAMAVDAPKEDCEKLYEFGRLLGMAFQLQDDLLDVFGNVEKFGKKIGGDIIANKKTYLLIKALETAQGKEKNELDYWLSQTTFDKEKKIAAVKSIYENLNIKELSVELMNKYFDKAFKLFDEINVPAERKKNMLEFTESLKTRDF